MQFFHWIYSIVIVVVLQALAFGGARKTRIRFLPGVPHFQKLPYKQYSGFLKASNAHYLHYWFVESENNPYRDPLIFWFNGGPGCSSMYGILKQNGPFILVGDGKAFENNSYSWTKFASIVYIESPAGVGYSFVSDANFGTDDDKVANENFEAMMDFYFQFPEFSPNPVYLAGESYAGVYVSMLADRLIKSQEYVFVNFAGIILGNPSLHDEMNENTRIRFAYSHGMIDEEKWREIGELRDLMFAPGVNLYDINRRCKTNNETVELFVNRKKLRKSRRHDVSGNMECHEDGSIDIYLNDERVRRALHIPFGMQNWEACSEKVAMAYKKTRRDMTVYVRKIVQNKKRVLLFFGDTDMVCNFMMGQQFTENLGLKLVQKRQPWYYRGKLAGMQTLYDGLTFLTVLGGGHMAAEWRRPQVQFAVKRFLSKEGISD